VTVIAWSIAGASPAHSEEAPLRKLELAAGFTPISYGFYDALGGDGHFDQFTTLPAAGLEFGANYRYRRYLALGASGTYVFSLGRSDFWSKDYEPGVHRFRLGPLVQFRVPGDSVGPFLNLSGGYTALRSKNYGSSYDAHGVYGALGLGGNIHLSSRLGMYVRYTLTVDHAIVRSMDDSHGPYMEDVPVLAFLQEVTLGLLLRL